MKATTGTHFSKVESLPLEKYKSTQNGLYLYIKSTEVQKCTVQNSLATQNHTPCVWCVCVSDTRYGLEAGE